MLDRLLDLFWYAPQDVISRSLEAGIWDKQLLTRPILDVGCGDGRISQFLFSRHLPLDMGIDLDPGNISRAAQTKIYKSVRVADVCHLPFASGSFSTAVVNSTLEHIKEDSQAIAEISRVLRPGGRLLITVPTLLLLRTLRSDINRFNSRIAHFHYRSISQWRKIFTAHRLRVASYHYYFPAALMRLWLKLFNFSTFKLGRRELWSWIGDSRLTPFIPVGLIKKIIRRLASPYYPVRFSRSGCWAFIMAVKKP